MTTTTTMSASETPVAPVAGGATIADRFRLDVPDPNAKKATGKDTLFAVVAGCLALVVAGVLTFVLYQHWEFLQGA